jgi:hypothetical protein
MESAVMTTSSSVVVHPPCERCKALESILQRERKELAQAKADFKRASARATDRLKLLEAMLQGEQYRKTQRLEEQQILHASRCQ